MASGFAVRKIEGPSLAGWALRTDASPSLEQFRHALSAGDKYTEKLLEQVRCVARSAVNQRDAAASGLAAIERFYQSVQPPRFTEVGWPGEDPPGHPTSVVV